MHIERPFPAMSSVRLGEADDDRAQLAAQVDGFWTEHVAPATS